MLKLISMALIAGGLTFVSLALVPSETSHAEPVDTLEATQSSYLEI